MSVQTILRQNPNWSTRTNKPFLRSKVLAGLLLLYSSCAWLVSWLIPIVSGQEYADVAMISMTKFIFVVSGPRFDVYSCSFANIT